MVSKIFQRTDGTYTLSEFEGDVQNKSVIPAKYSDEDISFSQRVELLKKELSN